MTAELREKIEVLAAMAAVAALYLLGWIAG